MQSVPAKDQFQIDIKSFLEEGAILQTDLDTFKLFFGPFTVVKQTDAFQKTVQNLIYKPDFWDFLDQSKTELSLLQAENVVDLTRAQLIELLSSEETALKQISEIQWRTADLKSFQQQFLWLQSKIKAKELIKGLPITVQIGQGFTRHTKVQSLVKILEKKSEQYLYGFWESTSGFMGFTPEIFIQKNDNQIRTMALAGTWNKLSREEPDFQDLKINDEHQIVVEDILNQLKNEKLVFQDRTEILELDYLFHLKTKFVFEDSKLEHFIEKLHPTAALGLYPRSKLSFLQFQKMNLQAERKNFGAPFGFIGIDSSFLVVAIRSIFWSNDEVSIYSGCGVTKSSDLQTEWQELEAKRNSVKKTFGFNL